MNINCYNEVTNHQNKRHIGCALRQEVTNARGLLWSVPVFRDTANARLLDC